MPSRREKIFGELACRDQSGCTVPELAAYCKMDAVDVVYTLKDMMDEGFAFYANERECQVTGDMLPAWFIGYLAEYDSI